MQLSFSGHCRHLTENKIDACFHKNVPIHVRDNLKSICFSNFFDVSIEDVKNEVLSCLVTHKEIKNVMKLNKSVHEVSCIGTEFDFP